MDSELEVKVKVVQGALSKQASRIAGLTLDLDLAYAQIELLTKQLEELKPENKEEQPDR